MLITSGVANRADSAFSRVPGNDKTVYAGRSDDGTVTVHGFIDFDDPMLIPNIRCEVSCERFLPADTFTKPPDARSTSKPSGRG
jgi:hypothetical protein